MTAVPPVTTVATVVPLLLTNLVVQLLVFFDRDVLRLLKSLDDGVDVFDTASGEPDVALSDSQVQVDEATGAIFER